MDKSFSGLFDGGTEEEESPFGGNRSGSRFLEVYGWHYTIYEAAKLHNITSDEVWNMKTIEYLNTLAYLKAYRDYQK